MRQGKLYISLFRAELEDAIEELEQHLVELAKRFDSGEITNYVLNENNALLKSEISCLKKLLPLLDAVNLDAANANRFTGIDDLAETVENMLQQKADALNESRMIGDIIRRKQQKVLKYLHEQKE